MALFVNHLTHLDVSIWSPRHGLTGMSWLVNATLEGDIGADGMLLDFGKVKPWIKRVLDDGPDHTLLVPQQADGIRLESRAGRWTLETRHPYPLRLVAPLEAVTALQTDDIDEASILAHCEGLLNADLPTNVRHVSLRLEAEEIDGAAFGYSHGLKRHLGNCQRIAHGHRSRIEIHQDGRRVPMLEHQWSQWLDHRYLVESDDLIDVSDTGDSLTCHYQAGQGDFTLTLPAAACAVLDRPTTVENIACWMAHQVAEQTGKPTQAMVFEGISKGATAHAPDPTYLSGR